MLLTVRAHPGASREAVEARGERALEVWVRKPAADGQACITMIVRAFLPLRPFQN